MSSPTCYWPNGSVNSMLVAANVTDNGGHSACCNPGHYFFSNGLCLDNSEMTFYRGGCTDKTWASSACPRYCLFDSGSVCGVWTCNNGNQFACDPDSCGNSSLMFTVNGGIVQQNAALQSAIATTSSSSTTSRSTSSIAVLTSLSTTATVIVTATCSPSHDVCPSHIGTYAGLGVGLGVPLLILLIALILVLLQLRRYRRSPAGRSIDAYPQGLQQNKYTPVSNDFHAGYQIPYKHEAPGRLEAELPSATKTHPRVELGGG